MFFLPLLLPLAWPPPTFLVPAFLPCSFFLLVCPPTFPVPAPWTALLQRHDEYEETEVKRPFVPWAQVTPRRCLRKCSSSLQSSHAKLAAYFSVHQRLGLPSVLLQPAIQAFGGKCLSRGQMFAGFDAQGSRLAPGFFTLYANTLRAARFASLDGARNM